MLKFNQFISELKNPKEIGIFRKKLKDQRRVNTEILLTDLFSNYGFHIIGTGTMATVFENPDYPYVIKVFNTDKGYLSYIKWVLKNQKNVYVPKIRGKVQRIDKNYFAIRIEKLEKFNNSNLSWEFHDICDDPERFLNGLMAVNYFNPEDKDLISLTKFLVSDKAFGGLDIFQGNIMMRGRIPVLIDPLKQFDMAKFGRSKVKFNISQFEKIF